MEKDRLIQNHSPEAEGYFRRAAEDEGVNDSHICSEFPQEQKTQKDCNPGDPYNPFVAFPAVQITLLSNRNLIHFYSTPPI